MDEEQKGIDWNKVPTTVRHLIEALRGGSETVIDKKTGKIKSQRFFTPKVRGSQPRKPMMPTGLRKYQLHNQEASLGLADKSEDY